MNLLEACADLCLSFYKTLWIAGTPWDGQSAAKHEVTKKLLHEGSETIESIAIKKYNSKETSRVGNSISEAQSI